MYGAKRTAAELEEAAREKASEVARAEGNITGNAGSNSSGSESSVVKIKNLKGGKRI